ncbi:kunitz-type serine protease inhibitor PILP-3-like [Lucilia cuprina]|uniref:kunitz-type serine protease inhibitor PILP-3-like n=1 Tax=Lucilia cuprina TaxID=7375 RepID=UPI001F06AD89|nr:kunitz-type serine protease inhibitor PILP-3-like [Lucilia cuprina]
MKYFQEITFLLVALVTQAMAQWQGCTSRPWIASCNQPPNWGHRGGGCMPRVLWWYDRNLRSCRQMWYRGCGGNANRWCSRSQCEQICRR